MLGYTDTEERDFNIFLDPPNFIKFFLLRPLGSLGHGRRN